MQLFVDMDGVLADFDAHYQNLFGVRPDKTTNNVEWKLIRRTKDFYLNIPPMPDFPELWGCIAKYNPIVLTGIPWSIAEAADNKRAWGRKHLGVDVEVRCCPSRDKCLDAAPGDILIDDWEKYQSLWVERGGVWITHRSAAETIRELKNHRLNSNGKSAEPSDSERVTNLMDVLRASLQRAQGAQQNDLGLHRPRAGRQASPSASPACK